MRWDADTSGKKVTGSDPWSPPTVKRINASSASPATRRAASGLLKLVTDGLAQDESSDLEYIYDEDDDRCVDPVSDNEGDDETGVGNDCDDKTGANGDGSNETGAVKKSGADDDDDEEAGTNDDGDDGAGPDDDDDDEAGADDDGDGGDDDIGTVVIKRRRALKEESDTKSRARQKTDGAKMQERHRKQMKVVVGSIVQLVVDYRDRKWTLAVSVASIRGGRVAAEREAVAADAVALGQDYHAMMLARVQGTARGSSYLHVELYIFQFYEGGAG